MGMANFRHHRNMNFVKRGMRVYHTHNKRWGRISSTNNSGNLNIIFDGDKYSQNCHPHWKMQYYDDKGNLIKEYKGDKQCQNN